MSKSKRRLLLGNEAIARGLIEMAKPRDVPAALLRAGRSDQFGPLQAQVDDILDGLARTALLVE